VIFFSDLVNFFVNLLIFADKPAAALLSNFSHTARNSVYPNVHALIKLMLTNASVEWRYILFK